MMRAMRLPTVTYAAFRGYAWSGVPSGMTQTELDALSRMISDARGDFPDPLTVETGIVSDGRIAAAFTLQNVENWDANGRASDYTAFALFPVPLAKIINFVELISNDFFWTPTHTPPTFVDYVGTPAEPVPSEALYYLRHGDRYLLKDSRAIGSILAAYGANSRRWVCFMQPDGSLDVTCGKWNDQKENPS